MKLIRDIACLVWRSYKGVSLVGRARTTRTFDKLCTVRSDSVERVQHHEISATKLVCATKLSENGSRAVSRLVLDVC
jgi:hypothetical protein